MTSRSDLGQVDGCAVFDLGALFVDASLERKMHGLSWAALGRRVGVSPSTIRRFERADDAEADGVLAVVRWLNKTPEYYVQGNVIEGARLAEIGCGVVRVDMELVAKAEGDARGARGRSRTTIQHLVGVAQRCGRPVASLTRLSEV